MKTRLLIRTALYLGGFMVAMALFLLSPLADFLPVDLLTTSGSGSSGYVRIVPAEPDNTLAFLFLCAGIVLGLVGLIGSRGRST
ncbi:hypothetical protein [Piscinibacter koreensis]|uniref:Uncharacterized protein n=1 Tax=Piscinibacter koreensis TaxID=2742824 RepID=A0A7Y6NLJ4_9BURK|nr:hypothetical protein [Schlegelella koreensis]NUZ05349.1 hypothetical protein [Schlegelella koreensis]